MHPQPMSSSQPVSDLPTPDSLETLRAGIDRVDEQIVALLSQRLDHVKKVVALKKVQGLPIYNPAREEDLISQRRDQARAAGLDPDHVEELYRCIIRQSRVRQAAHTITQGVRAGARVLLVGGAGGMGRYLGRWFGEAGYEVRTLETGDWDRAADLCREVDLALVTVPIHVTVPVIKRLAPLLPPRCLLADLTSIKREPVAAMLECHPGPVLGLHPLYGPSTSSMDQQIVVATPGRDPAGGAWLTEQLSAWGNIVMTLSPEEHDELMDLVQGVRHFATFAFGRFLAGRRVNLARTLEFSSPIYRLELGMVGRMFAQDAALYASIITASPDRRALLQEYVSSLGQALDLVERGETELFCREFRRIAEWFGPFCGQAMRESTFLIDKLVERF